MELYGLSRSTVSLLKQKNMSIAVAESCTGGILAGAITAVPGASEVFSLGIVAYSAQMKRDILGVPSDILERFGTVAPETAESMAKNIRIKSGADIGVGITGVAGPDKSEGKAVGTVYVAVSANNTSSVSLLSETDADTRDEIRAAAVETALLAVQKYLNEVC